MGVKVKHVFQAIYVIYVLEHNGTIHGFYKPGAGGQRGQPRTHPPSNGKHKIICIILICMLRELDN